MKSNVNQISTANYFFLTLLMGTSGGTTSSSQTALISRPPLRPINQDFLIGVEFGAGCSRRENSTPSTSQEAGLRVVSVMTETGSAFLIVNFTQRLQDTTGQTSFLLCLS